MNSDGASFLIAESTISNSDVRSGTFHKFDFSRHGTSLSFYFNHLRENLTRRKREGNTKLSDGERNLARLASSNCALWPLLLLVLARSMAPTFKSGESHSFKIDLRTISLNSSSCTAKVIWILGKRLLEVPSMERGYLGLGARLP